MMRYATKQDARAAVVEALGEYAGQHDVTAITDEAFAYRVDVDGQGRELLNTAGFEQVVDVAGFWRIVERHGLKAGVWQDNGGHYYLVRGESAWTATVWTDDALDTFTDAAADWTAGDWEPSESDGWVPVDDWQGRLDAERSAATGDRTRRVL